MKISNRTHPVLDFMEKRNYFKFKVPKGDNTEFDLKRLHSIFDYAWINTFPEFKKNIVYCCDSFIEAADLSTDKIMESNLHLPVGTYSGTHLLGNVSICYSFETIGEEDYKNVSIFVFSKDVLFAMNYKMPGESYSFFYDNKTNKNLFGEEALKKTLYTYFYMLRIWIIFKKYAQVETKYLPAGQKEKGISVKYVNDTKQNITILDSTWFTTLVKSDAFKVRGHFHLYWYKYKDGVRCEPYQRLVWVSDYDKEGYTSPARKLKQE